MEVDNSDILGGPILKKNQSSWFSFSTFFFSLFVLLVLYVAGLHVWTRVLIWREKSYRLYAGMLLLILSSVLIHLFLVRVTTEQRVADMAYLTPTTGLSM
jgi:hypothetical protein